LIIIIVEFGGYQKLKISKICGARVYYRLIKNIRRKYRWQKYEDEQKARPKNRLYRPQ
jgi:hypothetical protein